MHAHAVKEIETRMVANVANAAPNRTLTTTARASAQAARNTRRADESSGTHRSWRFSRLAPTKVIFVQFSEAHKLGRALPRTGTPARLPLVGPGSQARCARLSSFYIWS